MADHGTIATEEALTLLSKTKENYSIQNSLARFYIELRLIVISLLKQLHFFINLQHILYQN